MMEWGGGVGGSILKKITLSKRQSREQSSGQKEKGETNEDWNRDKEWKDRQRQVEKIGETSGSKM